MSPQAALHSEVFRVYLAIAAGLLVIAGLTIGGLRFALRKNVAHAWQAYRGWLVMIPLIAVCVFLGREATVAFFTLVAALGFLEFARASQLARHRAATAIAVLGILGTGAACLLPDPRDGAPGWYGLFVLLPAGVTGAVLIVPIVGNRVEGELRAAAMAVLGFVLLGTMFGHVAFLVNSPASYAHLLFLIVAVEVSDVSAYTFGRLWGRHALRDRISPRKTWEGALGGLAVSLALPWLLRFTFPRHDAGSLLMMGLAVGVGGPLGDLAISVIKRDLNVKDMGGLIPGHGGILDRIDSLIFAAPLYFAVVKWG